MPHTVAHWSSGQETVAPVYTGYPAWDRLSGASGQGTYVMLFVEIVAAAGMSLVEAIETTLFPPVDFQIDNFIGDLERASLRTDLDFVREDAHQTQPTSIPSVPTYLFWPADADLPDLPYWRVLHVGERVHSSPAASRMEGFSVSSVRGTLGDPIIAVIDDAIAYLNRSFTKGTETRFKALWLQSKFEIEPGTNHPVKIGDFLSQADIQRDLDSERSEHQSYQNQYEDWPLDYQRGMKLRSSHGTHVLDMAANSEDSAYVGQLDLLGVQLPPTAVGDTSGRRIDGYIAAGIAWSVTAAVTLGMDATTPRPLLINLSLGSLGGPGDETAFLAAWMDLQIARFHRLAGSMTPIHIVGAYGNSRDGQLVAETKAAMDAPIDLTWRVLPDDRSDSFLEMRAPSGSAASLTLRLSAPDPSLPDLHADWPGVGEYHVLTTGPDVIGAVIGSIDPNGTPMAMIALAPTKRMDDGPTAPSGGWKVRVTTSAPDPIGVSFKVRRDDTPGQHPLYGRQSYLDSAAGWTYDQEYGTVSQPAAGNPITRQGTNVAFAGAQSDGVILVGAYRAKTGNPDQPIPVPYSSEGKAGRPDTDPDFSALSDDGAILVGRRAAGVLTGSTTRLSGTSVAAPLVTRALAAGYEKVLSGDIAPEDLLDSLEGVAIAQAEDVRRLGKRALSDT